MHQDVKYLYLSYYILKNPSLLTQVFKENKNRGGGHKNSTQLNVLRSFFYSIILDRCKWKSPCVETGVKLHNCVLSPLDSHLSLPSSNTSTPFFASTPLKCLSHYVSNAVFSFISASGRPPACRYVVKIFLWVFATQRGSYSKTEPSTQIMTFSTLAPSSSLPCPDTTHNNSITNP